MKTHAYPQVLPAETTLHYKWKLLKGRLLQASEEVAGVFAELPEPISIKISQRVQWALIKNRSLSG